MTTPTLPGHQAAWMRPCSPVLVTRGTYVGLRGVVVSIADGIAMVAFDKPSISSLIALGLDDLALDLSDPTGRAHAAWWLGGVGASWHLSCDGHRKWEIHGGETPRAGVMLAYEGVGAEHRRMRSRPDYDVTDVPALDSLNPDDPRLLPDGSRWVDAEALRLVCLHVAGVSHG